jgi:lysozyme
MRFPAASSLAEGGAVKSGNLTDHYAAYPILRASGLKIWLDMSSLRFLSGLGLVAAFAAVLAGCNSGVTGTVEAPGEFDLNLPKPRDYPIQGIDVSKYQGNIDWDAVKNSGVKFVWIKATEGGDRADERFEANWAGAKQVGIAHGAYHFVYWCRAPMDEVTWFEQHVPIEADSLPPVLDVESDSESKTCHRHLEQQQTIADMKLMLEEMERHFGKKPIIYTSVDFYEAILSDGAFSDYSMWVRSTKHHPSVRYGSRPWKFWQYQADGSAPGIVGHVDRNVFYGSPEQWQAFLDSK